MSQVRIIPIGGQAENGKNMYCIEINHEMIIIDAGVKFPDSDKLGIDVVIPSYDFVKENKDKIAGIIITHGHIDVMNALPYLLNEVNVPIYASKITADLIEDMLEAYNNEQENKIQYVINRVNRNASIKIKNVEVEFFSVTHSIPGSVGVALWTDEGYIVYSGEYIIDFSAPHGFKSDIKKVMDISSKGVLMLLCESLNAKRDGYTSPSHCITSNLQSIFEDAKGRILITSYDQNIFRIKEIIDLSIKHRKRILFYNPNDNQSDKIIETCCNYEVPIISIPQHMIGSLKRLGNKRFDNDYVIIIKGNPQDIYHTISNIVNGGDDLLNVRNDDTFIVASPVLPGVEKIANQAHNDLYLTDANIFMLNKPNKILSMHASKEDIKVLIQILNPKYYLPIKGEYQQLIANKQVARDMGMDKENVVLLDNGQIAKFDNGTFTRNIEEFEVNDVMIDGIGIGDVGDKVINDRIQLSKDGIVIVGITVDSITKKIISTTDCQTRGFVYLKDFDYVIKEIINISESEIRKWQIHPETDILDIRYQLKDAVQKYIYDETGKKPVFMSVIIEI